MQALQHAKGIQELLKVFEGASGRLAVYFGGNQDASGASWCPDCTSGPPPLPANESATFTVHALALWIQWALDLCDVVVAIKRFLKQHAQLTSAGSLAPGQGSR
jgi:hypothetical protein